MEMHTKFIARDLGITEQEAIGQLERTGAHHVRGYVHSEQGRIYYDVMTERSDVTVTTAAIAGRDLRRLTDPREVVGYRTFAGTSHRGVFLETNDRATVEKIHDLIVAETRLNGASSAIERALEVARSLGITSLAVGLGPIVRAD